MRPTECHPSFERLATLVVGRSAAAFKFSIRFWYIFWFPEDLLLVTVFVACRRAELETLSLIRVQFFKNVLS